MSQRDAFDYWLTADAKAWELLMAGSGVGGGAGLVALIVVLMFLFE
jgi:hypothetical protein